jgi:hypothetical protein
MISSTMHVVQSRNAVCRRDSAKWCCFTKVYRIQISRYTTAPHVTRTAGCAAAAEFQIQARTIQTELVCLDIEQALASALSGKQLCRAAAS